MSLCVRVCVLDAITWERGSGEEERKRHNASTQRAHTARVHVRAAPLAQHAATNEQQVTTYGKIS